MSHREPFKVMMDQVDWRPTGKSGKPGQLWATHEGYLRIEGHEVKVYQLNDGQRVFDAKSCEGLLGMTVEEMFNKVRRD